MLSQSYSRYIFWGLLLLVPLSTFLGWSSRETWGTLLLSGTVFILLALDVIGGWRQPKPKFPLWLTLFAALILISTVTSSYRYASLLILLQMFSGLAVFALAQRHTGSMLRQNGMGIMFAAVLGGVAGYAIAQIPTLGNLELGVGATFVWKNVLAGFIALTAPMVLAQLAAARRWAGKLLLSLILAAAGVALFFTSSQTGWLVFGVGCGLMITVIAARRLNRGPLLRWLLLSLVVGVTAMAYLTFVARGFNATQTNTPTTWSRLTVTALPESSNSRLNYWGTSLEIIRDFPLFGVGLGNFSTHYPHYFRQPWLYTISPHSYLIYLLVTAGMIATATLCLFILGTAKKIFHWARRRLRAPAADVSAVIQLGWIVGLASLLLQGLVDISFEIPAISLLWWMGLGILYANLDCGAPLAARRAGHNFGVLGLVFGLIGLTMTMLFADNFYQQAIALQDTLEQSGVRINLLTKSRRLMPLSANTYEALANAYWDAVLQHSGDRQTNMDAALRSAQMAVTLDPESAHRQWMLGRMYFFTQTPSKTHWPQIIYHLEQAVVYDFHDPTYYRTLAEAYLRLGQPDRALAVIDRGISIYPPAQLQKIISGAAVYELFGLREKLEALQQLRQAIEPPAEN